MRPCEPLAHVWRAQGYMNTSCGRLLIVIAVMGSVVSNVQAKQARIEQQAGMKLTDVKTRLRGAISSEGFSESPITISNISVDDVALSPAGLVADVLVDFQSSGGAHLSNLIWIQVPEGGKKYWGFTSDLSAAEGQLSGTLRSKITVPKFKVDRKKRSVALAVLVQSRRGTGLLDFGSILFEPGQTTSKQFELAKDYQRLPVSNRAIGNLTLPR